MSERPEAVGLGVGSMSGGSVHLPWSFLGHRVTWGRSDYSFLAHPKGSGRAKQNWLPASSGLVLFVGGRDLSIVSLSNNKGLIMKTNRRDSPPCESLPPPAIILFLRRRHREPESRFLASDLEVDKTLVLKGQGIQHFLDSGALCLSFCIRSFFHLYFFLVMKLICNNYKIQSSEINN